MSADTIVPGAANPQAFNRYSYVLGNPLKYTDPTGHMQEDDDYKCHGCTSQPPPVCSSSMCNPNYPPSGGSSGGRNDNDVISTPSITSTPCPMAFQVCLPTATSTPSPTSIPTFTSTPEYTIGPNNNPAWEFPYAIGVADPIDFTIDIAGLVGDAASFVGIPGKIVWGLTEGGELVGIGKDVYDLAVNEDLSGISSTIFFDAAEKLAPDIMRMKNPGIISVAGNLWSISQNITITPK